AVLRYLDREPAVQQIGVADTQGQHLALSESEVVAERKKRAKPQLAAIFGEDFVLLVLDEAPPRLRFFEPFREHRYARDHFRASTVAECGLQHCQLPVD